MKAFCFFIAAIGFATRFAVGAPPAGWLDLENRPTDPFQTNGKAIVFIFVRTDCPISNRYAPEIRRLHEKFAGRGIPFWLVHPDPDASVEILRLHTKEYRYPCGVLRDPEQILVRLAEARITPEAAVFKGRQLVYHGRIDDRFVALGRERPAATRHDLEEVLEALLEGKPIERSSTPAIGCRIAPPP